MKKGAFTHVYNPDDEMDSQQYQGHVFTLRPNGVTTFLDYGERGGDNRHASPWPDVTGAQIAAFIAGKLDGWGAVLVSGDDTDADKERIKSAERRYYEGTLRWAEGVLKTEHQASEAYADTNAPHKRAPSADATRAREWLAKHEERLRDEGLVG